MTEFLQLLIYGVVLGAIITLGAVGVSLIYAILRFAHFAHGDLMTVGAYLALAAVAGFGAPLWLALPLAVAGGIAAAIAVDAALYRRLRRTAPVILLISSIGVALVLRSAVQLAFGTETAVYHAGITLPLRFGELHVRPDHLYILLGTVILVAFLHLFLQHTRTGKSMRAMADDPDLAQVSGIDTSLVILWTWTIAATLAVCAGVFLGMDTRLQPTMGWHLLLAIFAAAIVGGIGRPYGAIAGGMLVGIASELSTAVLSPSYKPAVAFAIMVLALVVRPTGLLAGAPSGGRR
jgi:branched-chain amino acid transport system permease protein/neutral amino acid transport system permease protein